MHIYVSNNIFGIYQINMKNKDTLKHEIIMVYAL